MHIAQCVHVTEELILKYQISNAIGHILNPACSVESKIEKIKFSGASNFKFVIESQIIPTFGYRRILLSHGHIVQCRVGQGRDV